ncbi:hypothetical protein FRC03_007728 [Tulasnella sp. 419]|nr:hypothetical protein FRC03_007728 [Tulasnella sp. 419]
MRKTAAAPRPDKTTTKNASKEFYMEEMEEMNESDVEENSNDSAEMAILLKAITSKSTSRDAPRNAAMSKKISQFADDARAQINEVESEARAAMERVQTRLLSLQNQEQDIDWKPVAMMFGTRTQAITGLLDAYDVYLEENGPKREAVIEDVGAVVSKLALKRAKSRKKLMDEAGNMVQELMENQQVAADARALIEGYKFLMKQ